MIRNALIGAGLAVLAAVPAFAQQAPLRPLYDALRMTDMIELMRAEGLAYGADLGVQMLPSGGGPEWRAVVERLYDPARMAVVVEEDFASRFEGTDPAPLLEFFASPLGLKVVELELEARRAFLDKAKEEAAREAFRAVETNALVTPDPHFEAVTAYIEANDLVELNVSGGLTSSLRFYQGLAEGGALEMSEAEMVEDIWQNEDSTREDTAEWVQSFLGLAYASLTVAEIDQYTQLSRSPEGRALNAALFAGFDRMYRELSYSLGLALANKMRGETL